MGLGGVVLWEYLDGVVNGLLTGDAAFDLAAFVHLFKELCGSRFWLLAGLWILGRSG